MPLVLNDRVLETTAVTGTGPATLLGASSGFQSFLTGIGSSNTTYYCIVNPAVANEWEVGLGTLNAGATELTRTTVYRSSNADAAVVFTAGTKTVFGTYPSSRSVNQDASANVSVPQAFTANGNITATAGGITANAPSTINSSLTITSNLNSPLTINNGVVGTPLANSAASFFDSVDSFSQVNYQNLSAGNNASTDFVATADNGTDTTNFVDLGINSSTYNLGTFTIAGANDGYVYSQSSNFAVGTAAPAKSIKFFQGGTLAANEVARFAPTTNNLLVGTTSDGAGTSKLRVAGIIETTSGGVRFPSGQIQTNAATTYGITIPISTTQPIQSSTYVFADANATTANHISMVPNGKGTNTLVSLGTPISAGSAYTNGTYVNVPLISTQTVTITIATPGVVTSTFALPSGTPVTLTTTGALPTGLVAGTTYFVVNSTGLTFNLAATLGGAAIVTSGSQSGVQSIVSSVGTGAAAAQVVVSTGAVSSITMPTTAGAALLGTISGGSGYVNGTYLNVPLTGGAGTGAVASSITVAGGIVTAVVLPATGAGSGYAATNVLTASNAFLGGTGSAFTYTLTQVSSLGINYAYGDTLSVAAASIGGTGSGFSVPVGLLSAGGDELEMDGIKVSAVCLTNGLVNVYIDASPGYIAGGRTFAYTLG